MIIGYTLKKNKNKAASGNRGGFVVLYGYFSQSLCSLPELQHLKPEYWNYLEKPEAHEFCVGHYYIDIDVDIAGVLCGAHVVETNAATTLAAGYQYSHRLMERPDDCCLGCIRRGRAGFGGYGCHARTVALVQSRGEAQAKLRAVQVNCVLNFCSFLLLLQRE